MYSLCLTKKLHFLVYGNIQRKMELFSETEGVISKVSWKLRLATVATSLVTLTI